ncbi:hypothetical protein ADUPG1_006815 [Aduncisulcus paluster]|uniref:Uncharacterized protein n=1 Tax=Aduncisulcus paluster TaxID=2918883 RepID=A0ABQ5KLC5_9EUKA|nr:hypothetical protein ADUPG1_006815 [Aduncisulcus paluster]
MNIEGKTIKYDVKKKAISISNSFQALCEFLGHLCTQRLISSNFLLYLLTISFTPIVNNDILHGALHCLKISGARVSKQLPSSYRKILNNIVSYGKLSSVKRATRVEILRLEQRSSQFRRVSTSGLTFASRPDENPYVPAIYDVVPPSMVHEYKHSLDTLVQVKDLSEYLSTLWRISIKQKEEKQKRKQRKRMRSDSSSDISIESPMLNPKIRPIEDFLVHFSPIFVSLKDLSARDRHSLQLKWEIAIKRIFGEEEEEEEEEEEGRGKEEEDHENDENEGREREEEESEERKIVEENDQKSREDYSKGEEETLYNSKIGSKKVSSSPSAPSSSSSPDLVDGYDDGEDAKRFQTHYRDREERDASPERRKHVEQVNYEIGADYVDVTDIRTMNFRRRVNLTHMSSVTADEAIEKLMRDGILEEQVDPLLEMLLLGAKNERAIRNIYGNMVTLLCRHGVCSSLPKPLKRRYSRPALGPSKIRIHPDVFVQSFIRLFQQEYDKLEEYSDDQMIRNAAQFFGVVLREQVVPFDDCLTIVRISGDTTCSEQRKFLKYLFLTILGGVSVKDLSSYMYRNADTPEIVQARKQWKRAKKEYDVALKKREKAEAALTHQNLVNGRDSLSQDGAPSLPPMPIPLPPPPPPPLPLSSLLPCDYLHNTLYAITFYKGIGGGVEKIAKGLEEWKEKNLVHEEEEGEEEEDEDGEEYEYEYEEIEEEEAE